MICKNYTDVRHACSFMYPRITPLVIHASRQISISFIAVCFAFEYKTICFVGRAVRQ